MAGTTIKTNRKRRRISLGMAGIYVVLSAWALTTIFPLFWIFMNSFKNKKTQTSHNLLRCKGL